MNEKNLISEQDYIKRIVELIEELKIEIYNSKQLNLDNKLMEFVEVYIEFVTKFEGYILQNEVLKINKMNSVLLKIEEVFRTKDYVILADLLIYELAPMLNASIV